MQCWLCRSRPGLHEHHVFSQAHGGTEGPTVRLCADCHTLLHNQFKSVQSIDKSKRQRSFFTAEQEQRSKPLLRALLQAQAAWVAAGKPGKQRLSIELDRDVVAVLQHLKADHQRTNLADFCAELLTQWARARYR